MASQLFLPRARRSPVERVGPWDENIEVADDFEFLMRLAIGSRFMYVRGLTGFYRWHPAPRLSRQVPEAYLAAQMTVLGRAEGLMTAERTFCIARQRALLIRYQKLAADAAGRDEVSLREIRRRIERLRERSGIGPGAFEAAFGFAAHIWVEKHVLRLSRTLRRATLGRLPPEARKRARLIVNRLTGARMRKG